MVELLVVIAIISVLSSFLLPALRKARQMATQASCTSNLRQVFVAVNMYAGDWNGMVVHNGSGANYYTSYSNSTWAEKVAYYLGYKNLDRRDSVLKCPQTSSALKGRVAGYDATLVDYAQNLYLGGWNMSWTPARPPKIRELKSTAYLLAMGNKMKHNWWSGSKGYDVYVTWFYSEADPNKDGNPWSWTSAPTTVFDILKADGHPGQAGNFLFGDGHSKFFSLGTVTAMSSEERKRLNGIGLVH